ncbi:hypothetical protein BDV98DRAFT_571215, partial [Pterulicium gracile]
MIFAFVISALLSSIALTAATPTLAARSCTPNFQGKPVSIINWSTGDWTPSALTVNAPVNAGSSVSLSYGEFRVEKDGQYPTGYIIKALNVPSNYLVVSSAGRGSSLILDAIAYGGKNLAAQTFYIECDSCGSGDFT